MGNRFYHYDVEKTVKQDVSNFIEIGWVESEKMSVKGRSVMLFAFCQDLFSNLMDPDKLASQINAPRAHLEACRSLREHR